MKITTEIYLIPETIPYSSLVISGIATPIKLPGIVLEASFELDDGNFLLFTTDDVVFEDSLHIIHLDPHIGIIDQITLTMPYATGIFKIESMQRQYITFEFFSQKLWLLTIATHPSYYFYNHYREVKRPFKIKHTLNIKKIKLK